MFRRLILGLLTAVPAAAAILAGSTAPAYAHWVPVPCDFITSGGFVFTDSTAMANFGAHGGCKNGAFWGHVNYVDHGIKGHFNSTQITGYLFDPAFPNARDICGWGEVKVNGKDQGTVRFRVRLEDNGEPGVNDRFGIQLSNGYQVTPRSLGGDGKGGGNVQLHAPNPSTTPPFPPPDEYTMCGDLRASE